MTDSLSAKIYIQIHLAWREHNEQMDAGGSYRDTAIMGFKDFFQSHL